MNLIPRDEYPQGAGYVRSSFEIARSAPGSEEEQWNVIQPLSSNASGACNITYNQVYVGEHENQYQPENFGLMGPLVCQDDFTMYWRSAAFWEKYFTRIEQSNQLSLTNRLGNIYRQYSYKAAATSNFQFATGKWTTQPVPQFVDMTDYTTGTLGLPTSELTQEMLDATARDLMQEGADEGDTDAWISQGEDGPVFPLNIGLEMSHRLLLNNSELRSDYNQSFMGWKDMNPVIQRLGAKRVIKNFRHMINRFPARWIYVPNGTKIAYTSTGGNSGQNITSYYDNTVAASNPSNTPTPAGAAILLRIPSRTNSTASIDVTKGQASVTNGVWADPSVNVISGSSTNVASFESVEVLNPLVMTEEVLLPVQSMPHMKLNPQNYYGDWDFVTGNDALLGIGGCTGITDPKKKSGRHFAEFRHALRPTHPVFGRMILFKRCANAYDTVTCS